MAKIKQLKDIETNEVVYPITGVSAVFDKDSNSLETVLEKKLDKEDGKNLVSEADIIKLGGIESGAEVNIIEGAVIGSVPVVINGKTLQLPEYPDSVDISGKVDKVEGKELSTNDFTDAEKIKLEEIEPGADVNKLESAVIGSSPVTIIGKVLQLPAYPDVSDKVDKVEGFGLTNITADEPETIENPTLTYATKAYVDDEIVVLEGEISALETTVGLKANTSDIPTAVSSLENDSKFLTPTVQEYTGEEKIQIQKNLGIEVMTQTEFDALTPEQSASLIVYIIGG